MNLVLQSFGRENEYKRGILTALSFYAHSTLPVSLTKVVLFTDQPGYFKPYFHGLPVTYVVLTPEKIRSMRGSIDFLHRMKIAVIEEAFCLSEGDLLYADSDTFFTSDPSYLMSQLSPGKSFMHEWEYQFESLRNWKLPSGQTFVDFLKLIESKSFVLADGRELKVTPDHSSWNAGVMMLHSSHKQLIPDVYALTDQFYPASLNHASEQYAFSVVLQLNTQLEACDAVVYHYWYRVKKQIIDQFLTGRFVPAWASLPLEIKLQQIKEWTGGLPAYFEKHEWTVKDKAIQAFNENRFPEGYQWAIKALLQKPFGSKAFLKDTLYHLKRHITHK
jgi:hypothetical protein